MFIAHRSWYPEWLCYLTAVIVSGSDLLPKIPRPFERLLSSARRSPSSWDSLVTGIRGRGYSSDAYWSFSSFLPHSPTLVFRVFPYPCHWHMWAELLDSGALGYTFLRGGFLHWPQGMDWRTCWSFPSLISRIAPPYPLTPLTLDKS